MTRLEFDSICRLCAKIFEKEKFFPIFNNETFNDKISLSERIKYCSSVEVAVDDGLPPQICSTCLLKLKESFIFRNQCILADITLKRLKDFNFDVNEIPNLSEVDIENQIINSENDGYLHLIYPAPEIKNVNKCKESIDEFDNSKNGRHKKNIHKLKGISVQRKKAFNKKFKEDISVPQFDILEVAKENIFSSPMIVTSLKKGKKAKNKDTEKQLFVNECNKERGQKRRNSKGVKECLNIYDKVKNNSNNHNSLNTPNENKKDESTDESLVTITITQKASNSSNDALESPERGRKRKFSVNKEKPSSFMCDYCQKIYPSEGGWRYHIRTVHNENFQPFICDLCGQSFKVKKNLEAHKNSIHFHLKFHLCDLCGRGFASKYSLKVHKSWHNDEKNFTCDVCGTKFRTRGKMNTHRSIHGGPKKFMCHICSRDFRWKKDFEIHMRTHTGEKPFKCSHCGKAFASLTNMKKHEKNHFKKLELDKMSDKLDGMDSPNKGKVRRNEFLDFAFGSEDVRSRQTDQVSGTFYILSVNK